MKNILLTGLAIYIVYLPVFLLSLILIIRKYRSFSVFDCWISNLGETKKSENYLPFAVSLTLLGFFNLFFAASFYQLFSGTLLTKIVAAAFSLVGFSLITMAFSPLDRKLENHKRSTDLLFLGMGGSVLSIVFLKPFSIWFSVFTLVVMAGMVPFAVSFIILRIKYGYPALVLMSKIRQEEKSFIFKNTIFLEWLALSLYFIWLFLLVLFTFYSF
jgi:hypothetical protein